MHAAGLDQLDSRRRRIVGGMCDSRGSCVVDGGGEEGDGEEHSEKKEWKGGWREVHLFEYWNGVGLDWIGWKRSYGVCGEINVWGRVRWDNLRVEMEANMTCESARNEEKIPRFLGFEDLGILVLMDCL